MKKYYMIKTMQNVFFKLLFCTLLFTSLGKVIAQTTMLSYVIAEDPVNFANRNFEAGTLTVTISYAVFCLKKKKNRKPIHSKEQVVQLLYHTLLLHLPMRPSSIFRVMHLSLSLLNGR